MAEGIDAVGPVGSLGSMDDRGSSRRNKYGPAAKRTDSAAPQPEAPPAASHAASPPTLDALQAAVQQINEHLARLDCALELQGEPGAGRMVAMIKNARTGEVLQRIPTEDGAQLAQLLSAWSQGGNVLLDLIA